MLWSTARLHGFVRSGPNAMHSNSLQFYFWVLFHPDAGTRSQRILEYNWKTCVSVQELVLVLRFASSPRFGLKCCSHFWLHWNSNIEDERLSAVRLLSAWRSSKRNQWWSSSLLSTTQHSSCLFYNSNNGTQNDRYGKWHSEREKEQRWQPVLKPCIYSVERWDCCNNNADSNNGTNVRRWWHKREREREIPN